MNAQEIWESDRAHLRKEMNAEITKRKIRKISFIHDGKLLVAETGKPNLTTNVRSCASFTKTVSVASI